MRASFDTTFLAYVYQWPGPWSPAFAGPFPCRHVMQDDILPTEGPLFGCDSWMTSEADLPGPTTAWSLNSGAVAADLTVGFMVSFGLATQPTHVVFQKWACTPYAGPAYFRYTLRPIP